jgi:hypothetical protein
VNRGRAWLLLADITTDEDRMVATLLVRDLREGSAEDSDW